MAAFAEEMKWGQGMAILVCRKREKGGGGGGGGNEIIESYKVFIIIELNWICKK
jgi:hypothetical protein